MRPSATTRAPARPMMMRAPQRPRPPSRQRAAAPGQEDTPYFQLIGLGDVHAQAIAPISDGRLRVAVRLFEQPMDHLVCSHAADVVVSSGALVQGGAPSHCDSRFEMQLAVHEGALWVVTRRVVAGGSNVRVEAAWH